MATTEATLPSDEMKDENSSQNPSPPPVAVAAAVNAHLNSNDDGRERSPQGRYVKVLMRHICFTSIFLLFIWKLEERLGSGAYKDVYVN